MFHVVCFVENRVVDFGFFLFFEVDELCVAAVFEVRDAVVIPAVLVITDEFSFGVCRKCRFASAAESQHECAFAVSTFVCAAVKRKNAAFRKVVVHNCEHKFFAASEVCRAENDTHRIFVVHNYRHVARFVLVYHSDAVSVFFLVKFVVGKNQKREFFIPENAFFDSFGNCSEHIVCKKRCESSVGDRSNRKSIACIGADDSVGYEEHVFFGKSGNCIFKKHVESFLAYRKVVR